MWKRFKTRSLKRYHFIQKTLLHLLESNFHSFKCKGWHHICICTFKNAGGNQNFHDSETSSANSFTQIDKENYDEKETVIAFQNIASVHPSLNLYYVSSALMQTTQAHVFSCDNKNGKNL